MLGKGGGKEKKTGGKTGLNERDGNEWTETEVPAPTEGGEGESGNRRGTGRRLVLFACFDSGPAVACMIFTGLCDEGPVTANKGGGGVDGGWLHPGFSG